VAARFVIMFAQDTLEDPASRMERDGFLDEIERIADAVGVFDSRRFDPLEEFLAQPGPPTVPEPARLEHLSELGLDGPSDRELDELVNELGVEVVYGWAAFARPRHDTSRAQLARDLEPRLLRYDADSGEVDGAPYLEPDLSELPELRQPKEPPRRLSTGEAPLAITAAGPTWRLTCTGCGTSSPGVRFRWQALEQTVSCQCR
jgi:hypothetical protein